MIRRLLAGAAAAAACIALTSCSAIEDAVDDGPDRDDTGAITESADLDAWSMKAGDCFDAPDPGEWVTEVSAAPCNEAHDAEVTKTYNSRVATYAEMEPDAEEQCIAALSEYVGASWESYEPMIDWYYMFPEEEQWESGADREIVCAAVTVDPEQALTSSLKDAAP